MVDVSDPLNPTFAGCFGGDGYVHDAQCTIYTGPDTEHQGKEVRIIVRVTKPIGFLAKKDKDDVITRTAHHKKM